MEGIILAAGRGERLRPLTNWLPKFMVPLAGVPTVVHVMHRLVKQGCEKIVLVVSSEGAAFVQPLKQFVPLGVDLEVVLCDQPGQMAALRRGAALVSDVGAWIAFCDNIFQPEAPLDFDPGVPIFVSVLAPEQASTGRYGVISDQGNPRIAKTNRGTRVQTGLFYLPLVVCSGPGEDLAAIVGANSKIREHVFSGWWRDVGEWDMWMEAEQLLRGQGKE
jgi:NDP-sugar pyrophosphorylase family protein